MNLLRRVISAAVLLGAVAACLWVGGVPLGALVCVTALVGASEMAGLTARLKSPPLLWLLYPLTIWWALRFYLDATTPAVEIGLAAAVVGGLVGVVVARATWLRWSVTLGGAAFVGLGLGYFVGLFLWTGRLDHFGLRLVVLALLGPIAGDTAAYFVGSAIGRHRFFPAISPKKSIEGAAAAALLTIAVLAGAAPLLVGMPAWQGAVLGALVTIAAQTGDLAESKLKREAAVKDSSNLIPGHGGVLDRLDSLLLVAPTVYWFAKVIGLS